jgi:MinD-like ATPase involved in chromosome partitioning or flagellar assembly
MIEPSHYRLAPDQAVALRRLVREARAIEPSDGIGDQSEVAPPRRGALIVVAGAKGGVGVTTLSLRLAEALAYSGAETIVIDANLRQADLAHVADARSEASHDLSDVFAGVCRTGEALVPLDDNLWLLPGAWAPAAQPDATAEAVGRWLDELEELAASGKTLVLDVGVGLKPWTESLWRRASRVVLVATPDKLAVLDAYATTKLARHEGVTTPISLLVNRAADEPTASSIYRRVNETCRRFLGESIDAIGWAPDDASIATAGASRELPDWTTQWLCALGEQHSTNVQSSNQPLAKCQQVELR